MAPKGFSISTGELFAAGRRSERVIRSRSPRIVRPPFEDRVLYTSRLSSAYRDDLESLLFFNPEQGHVKGDIVRALDHYGSPRLIQENGNLRIRVGEIPAVQVLFALLSQQSHYKLIGVIIYLREDPDTITILHVAVHPEFSASGSRSDVQVVVRLVSKVREIAGRIRGVQSIKLAYGSGATRMIPVRHLSTYSPTHRAAGNT